MASGFVEDADSGNFDTSGSPGLGFDFPHLAAIGGGSRRGSFHTGRRNHFQQQGTFVPIFFGGYPYYADDFVYDPSEQQAAQQFAPQYAPPPQIIVIQQPASVQLPPAGADLAPAGRIDSAVPAPDPAPVRDIGNFILVRRDGRIVFASAFSVVGPQVHFVSPDGIRRTLAVSDIDSDATREMNEAQGTTLLIHN
jgi:hypothetical protein